jgi:hypothetical protein
MWVYSLHTQVDDMSHVRFALTALVVALLSGCASETLFQSNFDATPVGQPPATAQQVGTGAIGGPSGTVVVVAPPVQPSGHWLQISRPEGNDVSSFQGKLIGRPAQGTYTFTATMFMPSKAQTATVQFEPASNSVSDLNGFLHLDFTPDNSVRIDDIDGTAFGQFPRDQPFIVQVTLTIGVPSTAHIILSGAGASGDKTYQVLTPFNGPAQQFGAIRVWQGIPHTGAVDVTNIVVSKKKS